MFTHKVIKKTGTFAAISMLLYLYTLYWLERQEFINLLISIIALFGLYWKMVHEIRSALTGNPFEVNFLFAVAVLFRVSVLFALPNLTDDFYRFVWDGRLVLQGESPYLFVPYAITADVLTAAGLNDAIFLKLNSPNYYSVYPPICQAISAIACWFFPENLHASVVMMKGFILLFEFGTIFLLRRLADCYRISEKAVLLYALNPLVIIELTGNLHFEGAMIFFTLLSFYCLQLSNDHESKKTLSFFCNNRFYFTLSAIALGVAICSKLLPLLFLPFLFRRLGYWKTLQYCSIVVITILILFLPFLSLPNLLNLISSAGLYFHTLQFNGSISYALAEIGSWILGYNPIQTLGKPLSVMAVIFIGILIWIDTGKDVKSWLSILLIALSTYFALAFVVHPWYITSLVAFSVLVPFRFAVVWSAVVMVTYVTYRSEPIYQEIGWVIFLEYAAVLAAIIVDIAKQKSAIANAIALNKNT
jgi:alpha-1,6-mannosyltransferase